jgi:type I restriction enzyme, S subunit
MSFARYPKYKDSGVEWLGEVPEHWALKPLWTFFRRIKRTGFADEQLLSVYRDYGVVLKASRDDNFNKPSDDLSAYQLVLPGDLAINKMKAWQGSVAISEFRGIVSPAYFIYEALHAANSRYLHYLMRSLRYITGYLSVSKGIRVNQWDLEPQLHSRIPLTVPPLAEQTHIATFLDRETAKIDELVAEQQRLMDLLREKRQTVISHAVTKGLNPNAHMKPSGIEWLGDVPDHWEVKQIRYFADVLRGKFTHRPRNDPAFYDGGYPFVQTGDITGSSRFITAYKQTLNERGIAVSKEFPKGTLVMAIAANIGDVAILDFPAYFPDSIVGLVPKSGIDLMFMYYLMIGMKQPMLMTATISTQMNLNVEQICSLATACPPREEQKQIAGYLDDELQKFDLLSAEAQRVTELLQERRTALISAAVTGQIDVRLFVERQAA